MGDSSKPRELAVVQARFGGTLGESRQCSDTTLQPFCAPEGGGVTVRGPLATEKSAGDISNFSLETTFWANFGTQIVGSQTPSSRVQSVSVPTS